MKILKCIASLLLIAEITGLRAAGEPFRTNINPALLYYQAFLLAPHFSEADWDSLYPKLGFGEKLPARFGKLVAGYDSEFQLLRQAAHSTVPCDWGVDFSRGPATLLPYLGPAKAATQGAAFRVMWDLQQGRQTDACQDLLAALVLGRKVAHDGTLASILVQQTIERFVSCTVARNFGQFAPATLKQLEAGIQAAPPRRTMEECVPTQYALFQEPLIRKIRALQQAHPGDDAEVMKSIHALLLRLGWSIRGSERIVTTQPLPPGLGWARLNQAAGGTSAGVIKLVEGLKPLEQQLARILALPSAEYERQMERFKAEVAHSSNPFVSVIFPALERVRPHDLRTLVYLAMVHGAIEHKLHGQRGLDQVLDPGGHGPFALKRFVFKGVDRGFQLTSSFRYGPSKSPLTLIFVEKPGPPFYVDGAHAGQAIAW